MRLYGVRGWGSAIAEGMLVLAGIPYAFVDVAGFDRPGPARDLLTAVNALAQVPALQLDDGSVLTETAAIALHLADLAPESGLVPPPGDPLRPRFLRLLVWLVANVYPTFTYGDYPQRWAPSAPGELLASTDAWRAMLYAWLEAEVAGPFVLGERCCALDIYLGTLVRWRPGEAWFAAHVPMLAAIGARVRAMPVLAGVMAANASSPDAG